MAGAVAGLKVIHSPPTRLDKYSGIRITSGRGQDLAGVKRCHQCRQKNLDFGAACTNQRNFKPCSISLCRRCLLNRYGEKAEELTELRDWSCPKCRGICNCSVCMKRQGRTPTGALIKTAKATGFSSVSEMLLKGAEWTENKVSASLGVSPRKDFILTREDNVKYNTSDGKADYISVKDAEKNSQDIKAVPNGKMDHNKPREIIKKVTVKRTAKKKDLKDIHDNNVQIDPWYNGKNFTRVREEQQLKVKHLRSDEASVHGGRKKPKISKKDVAVDRNEDNTEGFCTARFPVKLGAPHLEYNGNCNVDFTENGLIRKSGDIIEENNDDAGLSFCGSVNIQLPHGNKMTTICGIDVRAEDVGNALQFLEFCFIFGKVLDLRKGQAENVLRDLLHGRFARHGRYSVVAQFIVHILSYLHAEQEQKDENANLSTGELSWFQMAKKILFISEGSSKAHGLDALENATDFGTLDVSLKLKVLNRLCDEVLKTKMTRNWINQQNRQLAGRMKETKQELVAARDKEMMLKKKLRDETAEAVVRSGASLSKSVHINSEVKQAHAEVIKLKTKLMEFNETHDAVRVKPFIRDRSGRVYWKPNCLGRSAIVHQGLGRNDSLALDDQWFVLGDDEKAALEEYGSLRKTVCMG